MVEQFADTPTGALGDFACAFDSTDADIFAGNACALADITGGVDWVKRDKIACTFSNALSCPSSALGGSFADVSRAASDIVARAALLGCLAALDCDVVAGCVGGCWDWLL